ncbi:hypothetical protein FG386_000120 [Cryptosporidium ryanae]|uniref:uncharacterized protein n=1 Tax=Cryptosporidium ryanae TaxID=515981 RepID=UPI00351A6A4E|nr:hypothetical protein FG386_000120 [Cryptosporidium ryanae]
MTKDLLELQKEESVLQDNPYRWILFPIKYTRLWNLYKKYEVAFWTAELIPIYEDKKPMTKVNKKLLECMELLFSSRIYVHGTGLDTIILTCELLEQVQVPEARGYFSFTMCMENIYKEFFMNYNEIIRQNAENSDENNAKVDKIAYEKELEDKLNKNEYFNKMKDFISVFSDKNTLFSEKLIYYSIIKKIFSCGVNLIRFSFSLNVSEPGDNLTQLCEGLDRIRRDEQYQTEFCLSIAKSMKTKPSNEKMIELLEEAVTIEKDFILSVIDPDNIGIEREDIVAYLLYSADEILTDLKYPNQFNVSNPFGNIINDLPAPSQEEAIARQTLTQTLKAAHYRTYQEISNSNQFSTSQDF